MPSRECVCVCDGGTEGFIQLLHPSMNTCKIERNDYGDGSQVEPIHGYMHVLCDEEKHQIQRERVYVVSVNVCVRVFHLASHTADHYICSVTAVIVTLYSSFPHLQVRYTHTHAQKMPHAKL